MKEEKQRKKLSKSSDKQINYRPGRFPFHAEVSDVVLAKLTLGWEISSFCNVSQAEKKIYCQRGGAGGITRPSRVIGSAVRWEEVPALAGSTVRKGAFTSSAVCGQGRASMAKQQ